MKLDNISSRNKKHAGFSVKNNCESAIGLSIIQDNRLFPRDIHMHEGRNSYEYIEYRAKFITDRVCVPLMRHSISPDGGTEAGEERADRVHAYARSKYRSRRRGELARKVRREKKRDRAAPGFEHAPCSIWLSHVARATSIRSLQSRLAPRAGNARSSLFAFCFSSSSFSSFRPRHAARVPLTCTEKTVHRKNRIGTRFSFRLTFHNTADLSIAIELFRRSTNLLELAAKIIY